MSVPSPETLTREPDDVRRVIGRAGAGTNRSSSSWRRRGAAHDELAVVLAAADHTSHPVVCTSPATREQRAMASAATTKQPPHQLIWSTTNAVVASSCLHVVADLGVADHVSDEPAAAEDIATRCGARRGALERVLQLLAVMGSSRRCRAASGTRPRPSCCTATTQVDARVLPDDGLPGFAETFARLGHSIRTGAPAVETVEPAGSGPTCRHGPTTRASSARR